MTQRTSFLLREIALQDLRDPVKRLISVIQLIIIGKIPRDFRVLQKLHDLLRTNRQIQGLTDLQHAGEVLPAAGGHETPLADFLPD